VVAYRHEGFFGPMDTIKDRQHLEALHDAGKAPWVMSTKTPLPEPTSG
jgi:glucose-1-phosphate cytidylyltransferase